MDLSYARARLHDVPVLRVSGEVDLASAAAFESALLQLIEDGSPLLVVDISEVTFFDSTGLKVLDSAQRVAAKRNAGLALVCPQDRILRLFQITGLDDRFSIHPTAEKAAASG